MTEELVYVLGMPGCNTVKIGRTTSLAKRVADIQRMSPVPLTPLWTCPGGYELETHLHRHFADLRSHGEWFTFRRDPVRLIQWAVEDEPWRRPKVSMKKVAPRTGRGRASLVPEEVRRRRGVGVAARAVYVRTLRDYLEAGASEEAAVQQARLARQRHKEKSGLFEPVQEYLNDALSPSA